MEFNLKLLLEFSTKFKKILVSTITSTLTIVFVLVIIGATVYKHPFDSNPFYFVSIALVVLLVFSYYFSAYLYQKKAFKIVEKIDIFGNDFVDDLERIYYGPISCVSKTIKKIKIIFNSVNNLSEEDLKKLEANENKPSNKKEKQIKDEDIILKSERLYVRHFNDSDLKKVRDYRNDERCNIYQSYSHFSLDELKRLFADNSKRNLYDENANFALVRTKDNQLVGEIFASNMKSSKEYYVGFTIIPEFQRNGYAFEIVSELLVEAATKLKGYKFVCTIYEKNERSIHLVEKLEFKKDFSFIGEKGKILVYKKSYN